MILYPSYHLFITIPLDDKLSGRKMTFLEEMSYFIRVLWKWLGFEEGGNAGVFLKLGRVAGFCL